MTPEEFRDLIAPIAAGWLVYSPDTAHSPTVSEGRALVLYLLPQGAIEFVE